MNLTNKTTYGLQALLRIAIQSGGGGISGREISQKERIPLKFLEQILATLKKNKLIKSFRGRSGGYVLNGLPESLSLYRAIEVLEGGISLSGGRGEINQALKKAEEAFTNELKRISFDDLINHKLKGENIQLYVI